MNQVMRVSDRVVLWAVERPMAYDQFAQVQQMWRDIVGDSPRLVVFPETQIHVTDGATVFEFEGAITPEVFGRFKEWWDKEVVGGE